MLVSYFFCRYDDSESILARTIVGSIARQLLGDLLHEIYAKLDGELQNSTPDVQEILRFLKASLRQDRQYIIVIDGLNECEDSEAQLAIDIMESLLNTNDLRIRLYYSCRSNSIAWPSTDQCLFQLAIRYTDVEADINTFIHATLEKKVKDDVLQVGDPYVILAVKQALIEGAQGMSVTMTLLYAELLAYSCQVPLGSIQYSLRVSAANRPRNPRRDPEPTT